MLLIKDTLVSLDLIEDFFVCDLEACKGQCCIDGDAGAPVTPEEMEAIDRVVPLVKDSLRPRALQVIEQEGTSYIDSEGDLVTQITDGADCVFTTYAEGGVCLCALEKAQREGKCRACKPMSCHLYPVRLRTLPSGITALNIHKWDVCRPARRRGRREGIRAYEFLREPLTRRFGEEWYAELSKAAGEWLAQHPEK